MRQLATVTAALFVAAGCSNVEFSALPPAAVEDSLTIRPNIGMMCLGDTAVLRAQLASSGASVPVHWRSDSTRVLAVDDSGVARTTGVGITRIWAAAVENPQVQASMPVLVRPDALISYNFTSILVSGTSTAVDPASVRGAIEVVSPVPGHDGCVLNPSYDRAELHVRDANGTRDTVVAVNTAAPITPGSTVRFTFDTGARLANGARAFPNGTYVLTARLISTPVPQRNWTIGPAALTIANP